MKRFTQQSVRSSIRMKLTLLVSLASGTALLIACASFVINHVATIRDSKVRQLTALAELIASNSTAALSFSQQDAAEELLASLKNRPTIKYACITDTEGELFAAYRRQPDDQTTPDLTLTEGHRFTQDGYLDVVLPVVEDDEVLGNIHLHASMDDLRQQLVRYAVITLIVVTLALGAAVLFSTILQRAIAGPILTLAETAQQISTQGDYSLRVEARSNDEIGVLFEQFNAMLDQIEDGEQQLRDARDQLEVRVKERTEQLETMHTQLLDTARQAGMAEVATSVLHNVGNILNSVNVSSELIRERLKNSEVKDLNRALEIMDCHSDNLAIFVTEDPQGKYLAPYLTAAGKKLENERGELLDLSRTLSDNLGHIKTIVAMQQSYTQVAGLVETLSLEELIHDALKLNMSSFEKYGIKLVCDFEKLPYVTVDRHKVLQIIVNLLKNAKESMAEQGNAEGEVRIRLAKHGDDRVRIEVSDEGIGIAPENASKIFTYGFTTKKSGHGFGLHSCANIAKEMGGSLSVDSDGVGTGATFRLEIPFVVAEVAAIT